MSVLSQIESVKGKTDSKFIRLSNEYARDVLGWQGYAPWLYVYSAVAEKFKEGWIPDNYYGWVVVPKISGVYGEVCNLKSLSKKLFQSNVFPDLAYYVNGLWFSNNHEVIQENQVKDLAVNGLDKVIFKADKSVQGKNIVLFEKNSFDTKKIKGLGNGVLQNYIEQHQFFHEMMPASVATLRITTVLDRSGNIAVRACYLRLGRNLDTHVKSASHIRIPVNLQSGELEAQGYLPTWLKIDRHPDTNIIFVKRRIPCFSQCLSTALGLHKLMPYTQSIGWDIIVDKDNQVKVMECNGDWNDIKFSEATQGPCFLGLGWEKLWQKTGTH
jgi:hypothetical protein